MIKGPAALLATILATTFFVLPAAAPAQATTTPPPFVEPTATVHGVVKDTTGAPIAGACVDVVGPLSIYTWATTCVGADGAYSLRVPANNPFLRITARATGFHPVWWPNKADFASSATGFTTDEDRTADFVLGGAVGTLTGSVTRQNGDADRHTWINLYPVGSDKPAALIIAKADGTFSRADIPVGQYQIKFAIYGYAEQWHPAKASQAEAATVTISADQMTSLTEQAIAVTSAPDPRPLASPSGVVKFGGQLIADAEITALNIRDGSITKTKSDASGRYRLDGLVSGCNYSLSATASGHTGWAQNNVAPTLFPCLSSMSIVDLLIPDKTGTINGVLRSYNGGALPNNTYANLVANGITVGRIPVQLDGTYKFTNVPVGTYTIRYTTARYNLVRVGAVSVADGQTTEVADTSLAPTYLEVSFKAKDTGAPVSGACATSNYGAACANADGTALIGPMWTQSTSNFLRITAGVDYFGQEFSTPLKVGQVNTITVELSPAATVTFPIVKAGGEKFTDQICVYAVQPRFTVHTEPARCAQPNADGIVRIGPFQPGTARLLVVPSNNSYGAQWLGSNGGTGRMEQAAPVDLRIRQAAAAPKATIDPSQEFTARLLGAGSLIGCLSTAAGRLKSCSSSEMNVYSLGALGPYEWPITWQPNSSGYGRTTVLSRPGRVDLPLAPEGRLTVSGPFYQGGSSMPGVTAYDAYTGEVISHASTIGPGGTTFDRLGNGRVVIQFGTEINGQFKSCWLKTTHRLFRFGQPYFSTTAGQHAVVSDVTCTQQEPMLLKPVEPSRRLPVTPVGTGTTVKTTLQGKLKGHSS